MNKPIIPIIFAAILAIGIGAFFIFQKHALPESITQLKQFSNQPLNNKCGDGVCDAKEKANPNLCPEDCAVKEQSVSNTNPATPSTPPATTPLSTTTPKTENTVSMKSTSKDSPFGMHPASIYEIAVKQGYAKSIYSDALSMGVQWHRPSMYMVWSAIQKDINNPQYDFSAYDKYYGEVPPEINIFANITSRMKQESEYTLAGSLLPADEQKYLNFVKAVAERYDGDGKDDMPGLKNPILYWQVGNEPNIKGLKDFAKFQKITYQAIKETCPQCKVVIGGVAQPIIPGKGFIANVQEYFDKFFSTQYEPYLKELNGEGFDIFDFHWYGTANGDYRKVGPVYERIKMLLKKYGFDGAPIWITEMGTYSGDPSDVFFSSPYQTESEQAADYLKRFVYPLSLGIKKIFPAFGLMEGFKFDDGYFDHTGFIYEGKGANDLGVGVKKLSYYTYKKMTEVLEGSDWNTIQTIQENNGVYVYKFIKDGKSILVAWNDNSTNQQVTISNINSSQVKITEAVPKYASGKDVADYNTAFNAETKTVSGGKITITLGGKPVFVEGK